mmetsp:Transcript_43115/g.125503  ORF Transcript_43115/g.125503 Transcript_43115/m.125503 type:complete len:200 (-) Transcript_43115:252-851(-)
MEEHREPNHFKQQLGEEPWRVHLYGNAWSGIDRRARRLEFAGAVAGPHLGRLCRNQRQAPAGRDRDPQGCLRPTCRCMEGVRRRDLRSLPREHRALGRAMGLGAGAQPRGRAPGQALRLVRHLRGWLAAVRRVCRAHVVHPPDDLEGRDRGALLVRRGGGDGRHDEGGLFEPRDSFGDLRRGRRPRADRGKAARKPLRE